MILALAASLAIVALDHASLRAAPRSNATELTALWQGELIEVRGEHAGYLKVYDFRRERGGYLRSDAARAIDVSETGASELLAVLRFLRPSRGAEALGISYAAAYLRAVPARALTAEPFDAIADMSERLAEEASGGAAPPARLSARLDVVEQFGVHMQSFEREGHMQVCYDGDMFRRVIAMPGADMEARARALLGLTRPDCIDPDLGPVLRGALDRERGALLDEIDDRTLGGAMKSRLHARRAGVWAARAFEAARRGEPCAAAAERALAELLAVRPDDLPEDRRGEYLDAVLRVAAIRWAAAMPVRHPGLLALKTTPGEPGQTCITLETSNAHATAPLLRRCTYGVVWMDSAEEIAQGSAEVIAVQPLESWRELWVFHRTASGWRVDVLPPGTEDPEQGYVEYAGFVPGPRLLLTVREVRQRGRVERRFEEHRLDDLALVRQANAPDALRDFGRWQDVAWRRDTLALRR